MGDHLVYPYMTTATQTLDLVNKPAPLAPELAMKEDLHGKERQKQLKTDKVINHLVMAKKKRTRSLDLPPPQ